MDFLPSLAPQDSYALWYQPSNSNNPPPQPDPTHHDHPHIQNAAAQHNSRRHQPNYRTPLARLRLDEEYIERRKFNIQNFGSSWIKPVGISKSLHQLREEEREMKEHQEALRREALAQELAEAEAEGAEALLQDEGEMEEVRDLDDDVPDADAEATGFDADDTDDEEEDEENENETSNGPHGVLASQVPQDIFREALARGQDVRTAHFGDGASTIEDEEHSGILQEEDLVHDTSLGLGMDVDADLDADIPEAEEEGMYEHTDTEEELSSSEDDESVDQGHLPQQRTATSQVRSDGTQNSMDFSSLISASSQAGTSSSPRLRRRA